jgi:cytochrome c peroxidase
MLSNQALAVKVSLWAIVLAGTNFQSMIYAQQRPVPAQGSQIEQGAPPLDNRTFVRNPAENRALNTIGSNVVVNNIDAPPRIAPNPMNRIGGNRTPQNGARNTDQQLRNLIVQRGLSGDPSKGRNLPGINSPLAQLGKTLFFSKSLGGGFDTTCVSCHHPALGGTDNLSLSVGVDAELPDLLGVGRIDNDGLPLVPRNAPTIFNIGFWDRGLFWDSRVERLLGESGTNGNGAGIRTPDSPFGIADDQAGDNLVMAQARFPMTSSAEIKTEGFENGSDNDAIRSHLAARIGNYGSGEGELPPNMWIEAFQNIYGVSQSVEVLVSVDNIVRAISESQRSMVFIDSP